ncbi:class I SAM-dependent methyltransferase [Rhizobium sp. VS19-DR104.2]|uniref:class I SAM-dependent methyltransferase n=1 Tax=unclassified Rhizobium TaxID=2613769 RepID=UPI001CC40667|nr:MULTISPECIES: class I SAM-dependent methyltransferase [unclassified Rhizobium]MBZ5761967.1 class I SAM-dependent methyltransferase [Rhizobium sp. VS19-DR96]MBZ5768387.1 class I SAM-dependent methyltransferase [Rhizobium sp. VS19-DR129.2]MBZ5775657.1 class I SAM-dependent methyltransferase [Rhizobium sp. VS19-DRK62.2]MBZ5786845.1 class I SAM-dependent methyltransferase [Rhizobium sp. VS19-DR121]MBZ5804415.1 class I SAM-dependent methyltransferase [Rhizobium sp. VS19-DR181]
MINETEKHASDHARMQAEFDLLADEYRNVHEVNIAITGEAPEYFSEYKIADLAGWLKLMRIPTSSILDFGSGIGNSLPYFRKYFPDSAINCADVSSRSIEIAQTRFPGDENYLLIDRTIPLPTSSQDVVFSACVFHHIPHEEHSHWLTELRRVTKPGGVLAIYEHNPLNPLTLRAVNTCPLDVNAHLIRGGVMRGRARKSGWSSAQVAYKVFFPAALGKLRPLEQHLEWLGLGAQYRMLARKSE